MLIGALGASAISQIAGALTSQGQAAFRLPDKPLGTAATPKQADIRPEPATGQSPLSGADAKRVIDLKSLLLSIQAEQSETNPAAPSTGRQAATLAERIAATASYA